MAYFEDDFHLAVETDAPLSCVHGDVATDLQTDVIEHGNKAVMDPGTVDIEDGVLCRVRVIEQTHSLRPLSQFIQLLLQMQAITGL